jgi:hypothetical protein
MDLYVALRRDYLPALQIKYCLYVHCRNILHSQYFIFRLMRFTCWLNKATNTHSEYVIITAFPQQQWFHKRASMLSYM